MSSWRLGLFPAAPLAGRRFPFYDSVFDLVHAINTLDEGGAPSLGQASRTEALEFFMFDIDRVLRASTDSAKPPGMAL
ncbi:hypothetical protein MUK42_37477 [Musa troglodytarum]|uniref:Uncharacterized protein n=1 Tax=Musa troglodytarum TaxID=320322 RepID=A0A9E7EHF2_9LILI|nr:hypothetical protein MUK42_37477 [Musa troglodytarum]